MSKTALPWSVCLALFALLLLTGCGAPSAARTVEQWGVYEMQLPGPSGGNPFVDVTLSAEFANGTRTLTIPGFYDGNGAYKVRFSPPTPGNWTYVTHSNKSQLNAQRGALTATAPTGANHGPLQVCNTFHLQYADGAPFYEIGTTCYAWIHQTDALQQQTLATLAASPFNKIRMCIFPKWYVYNRTEPPFFAFPKKPDGTFDFARFDPAFWQHAESRILDLQKLGIQADLILFHPYDHWGFSKMDAATCDRYLRYCIARLSAYRNVWWSLANEWDFMTLPTRGFTLKPEDWDRFFSILQQEDPYHHFRGIHNGNKLYDHTKDWVTHASIQNSDLTQGIAWREKYRKPIVVDECRYEGNIPQSWGALSAKQMVHQFWVGAVNGIYVGHGETYRDPNDILWWSKGGTLHGESPARIAYLKSIMESLPYTEMTPKRIDPNTFVLAKPGAAYLVLAQQPGSATIKLEGTSDYTAQAIDTWNMKAQPLPRVKPGDFTFTAPSADYVVVITAKK